VTPKLALHKNWGALEGEDGQIESFCFSNAHASFFTTFLGAITQWSLDDCSKVRTIQTGTDSIMSFICDPQGQNLYASSEDGKLVQYSVEGGKIVQDWTEIKGEPFGMEEALAMSSDGQYLFTGEDGMTVQQWSTLNKGDVVDTGEVNAGWIPLIVVKF